MQANEVRQEALSRAQTGQSVANYAAIFSGFAAKGIAESEIRPRENVFTFHAWKALGRVVRRGEHGVKVCTFVDMTKKDDRTGESVSIGRKARTTTVFHVSQTDPVDGARASDDDGHAAGARAMSEEMCGE
jgi:antirestriction protein ArdC